MLILLYRFLATIQSLCRYEFFGLLSDLLDTVLCFTAFWSGGDVEVLDRFIEIDRTTESYATVMAKLRRYVELYRYRPRNAMGAGWRAEFDRFPKLIVVLCGAPDPVLVNRRRRLLQLCTQDQVLAKAC